MTSKKSFYVTTPIYYPNDIPHIGHAYTTIAADILARWNKLCGKNVFFLTGTDEHGKKIQDAAKKAKKSPQDFVESLIPKFKEAWKKLSIEYDRFIRTTEPEHEEVVKFLLQKVYDNGDIYEGTYEGYYCTACETYYTEKDLVDGSCPIHKLKIEKLKEDTYFFKLSKYQKRLLDFYNRNPEFISPENRRLEIINRVKEGLQDLSISRTSFSWGIPLPFDNKHVCYVWFDALANYISGINYLQDRKKFTKYWPADIHLIGKDILWFHAVIWPAILLSAEIELPKKIFAHGWWTFDKEKISKSKGKVINIDELVSIAGVDSARYFLFRAISFGEDGDFSEKALINRHNNELADKLGNLVTRISALAEKYGIEETKQAKELSSKQILDDVSNNMDKLKFHEALNEIFSFIDRCNEYIQTKKLWETADKKAIYQVSNAVKDIAILLSPFLPSTAEKIAKTFNFEITIKSLKTPLKVSKIKKADVLFKKIENEPKRIESKANKLKLIEGIMGINQIRYEDFAKLELRVATIRKVEDIEGADKLYKLEIDLGKEKRTIVAGIKQHYKKDELKDKQIVVVTNLEPRTMKGIESKGMLLAAVSEDHNKVVLISPDKRTDAGTKVQ
ncbi:MAG: methionine--tRNA ligase [Candidatus Pacearchaeota archaeon]